MNTNGCKKIEAALAAARIYSCDTVSPPGEREDVRFVDIRMRGISEPGRVLNALHAAKLLETNGGTEDWYTPGRPKLRFVCAMDNYLTFEDLNAQGGYELR